jgi:hypothetical protein
VDFSIDVVVDDGAGAGLRQCRFTADDLAAARDGWHAQLERALSFRIGTKSNCYFSVRVDNRVRVSADAGASA